MGENMMSQPVVHERISLSTLTRIARLLPHGSYLEIGLKLGLPQTQVENCCTGSRSEYHAILLTLQIYKSKKMPGFEEIKRKLKAGVTDNGLPPEINDILDIEEKQHNQGTDEFFQTIASLMVGSNWYQFSTEQLKLGVHEIKMKEGRDPDDKAMECVLKKWWNANELTKTNSAANLLAALTDDSPRVPIVTIPKEVIDFLTETGESQ